MKTLKNFDNKHISRKIRIIAGVDEAGRGPLAGPVVAAAVIFDRKTFHKEINDSKKLSEVKREELYKWIVANCKSFGVGIIDHKEIDEINILQATLEAMRDAVEQLHRKPHLILIDGNKSFHSSLKTKTVIKGDAKSFSIAAASIVAKVTRDKIMRRASNKYPVYRWDQNKGYGTHVHIEAVKKYGASPMHRKTFLKNILTEENSKSFFQIINDR